MNKGKTIVYMQDDTSIDNPKDHLTIKIGKIFLYSSASVLLAGIGMSWLTEITEILVFAMILSFVMISCCTICTLITPIQPFDLICPIDGTITGIYIDTYCLIDKSVCLLSVVDSQSNMYDIIMPVYGHIEEYKVKCGDYVHCGDVLAIAKAN